MSLNSRCVYHLYVDEILQHFSTCTELEEVQVTMKKLLMFGVEEEERRKLMELVGKL